MKKDKFYLNILRKIQPGFKVQSFLKFPCPWIEYNPDSEDFKSYVETYGFPNHRQILDNEVVIDVDAENKRDGKEHADMVERKLKTWRLSYKRYESGGDGEHFHLLFKSIPVMFEPYYVSRIKYVLIQYILGQEILRPQHLDSHICLANKKLIQIEHAKHRKGGIKKLISGDIKDNELPKGFDKYFQNWFTKRKASQKKIESLPEPDSLNCINFFEGKTINKCNYFDLDRSNYRTLFLLTSYYKKKYGEKKSKKLMYKWLDSLPKDMKEASIGTVNTKVIDTTVKYSNGSVSCMYRMDLLDELQCEKVCKGCPLK